MYSLVSCIDSTAELKKNDKGIVDCVGNKTEGALLFLH